MAPLCKQITLTCSVSTPVANMVKSCSFNSLWTMITTMFQEKTNTYHISEPIIRTFFFPTLVPLRSLSSSFVDSFSFAMKRCKTRKVFIWHLCRSVMWSILVPLLSLLSLFAFFAFFNSAYVFNKTNILLGLAGYQMIKPSRRLTHLAGYLLFNIQRALVE